MKQKSNGLNVQAIALTAFLIIQYLLGMAANLFVPFPPEASGATLWKFAWIQVPVAAHIVLGIGLLIGATVFAVRSMHRKDRVWILFSSIGFLAILAAEASGTMFMETQSDWYSYIMSVAFVVVLVAYGWGLYASRKSASPEKV
jgi:hypothetical protein